MTTDVLTEYARLERERDNARAEAGRLRAALEDAATYLRLGMTWTVDTDRHVKMKAAWERAREACDGSS